MTAIAIAIPLEPGEREYTEFISELGNTSSIEYRDGTKVYMSCSAARPGSICVTLEAATQRRLRVLVDGLQAEYPGANFCPLVQCKDDTWATMGRIATRTLG